MSGAGTGIRRLEMAIALRDGGRTEEALTALQEVAERGYKRPEEEEEGEWAGAAYELALVLHALGRHAEGDVWLRRLGFRHRLADNIFSCPTAPAAAGGSGGSTWRQQVCPRSEDRKPPRPVVLRPSLWPCPSHPLHRRTRRGRGRLQRS